MFLFSIFLLFIPVASRMIPLSLREEALSVPSNGPVDINVDITVLETEMDFNQGMLTIFGKLNLKWFDSRKSWTVKDDNYDDFISIESAQEYSLFRQVLASTWKPGVYHNLHFLTFKDGPRYTKDRISFTSAGNISLDCRFAIPISCNSINNNYPFDRYSCWFNLPDFNTNKTVKYNYNQMLRVVDGTKHEGHEIVATTSETELRQILLSSLPGDSDWIYMINFKTEVKRSASRLLVTVLTPTLVICVLDALFFIFSSSLFFKCALIPAYFILFDDIHEINTIYDWPPIVCFFFARLISTGILCSLSLTSLILKGKTIKQEAIVTLPQFQKTRFQKIREFLRQIPHRTLYRFISLICLTVVLYIVFYFNLTMF